MKVIVKNRNFLKPGLSVATIGKWRFLTGIVTGIIASVVLSYFFNYFREALRMLTFTGTPVILSDKEFRQYDLFFAALSASLGFGFTVIIWMSKTTNHLRKKHRQRYSGANALFIIYITLLILGILAYVLVFGLYTLKDYDNQLDFLHSLKLLLILTPVYLFFAQWNILRLIFKTRNWILLSLLFYALIVLGLYKTTYINRDVANNVYYMANKEYIDYIDSEFEKAKQYGIYFPDSLKQILIKKSSASSQQLVKKLKEAFGQNKPLPLDTLILEKIVIHTLKTSNTNTILPFLGSPDDNWPYALPEQVYYQIQKHDPNSVETKVLFEILREQALLFTTPKPDWKNWDTLSRYEKDKANFKFYLLYNTETIQSRLIQVLDKLRNDEKYRQYHYLLPKMEFDKTGSQKEVKINLD